MKRQLVRPPQVQARLAHPGPRCHPLHGKPRIPDLSQQRHRRGAGRGIQPRIPRPSPRRAACHRRIDHSPIRRQVRLLITPEYTNDAVQQYPPCRQRAVLSQGVFAASVHGRGLPQRQVRTHVGWPQTNGSSSGSSAPQARAPVPRPDRSRRRAGRGDQPVPADPFTTPSNPPSRRRSTTARGLPRQQVRPSQAGCEPRGVGKGSR
jgi:hypothetical protein